MNKYKDSTCRFFKRWSPIIVTIFLMFIRLYPLISATFLLFGHTDMICSMSPIDESRDMVAYFQNDLLAINEALNNSPLSGDDSTLSPEQLKDKTELIEARKDSQAALRHHLGEVDRLKSEDNTAEGSSSQSHGKRTLSEVSGKTLDSSKTKRTR